MYTGQLFPAVCFWKDLIPDAVKYWFSVTSVKALIFLLWLNFNDFSNKFFFCLSGLPYMISHAHLPSTVPSLHPCLLPAPNLWMLLLLFQITCAWFHFGYERRNNDDRGNWLANFSFDYVHYSWKELKNGGSPRPCWKNRKNVLDSANEIQANFLLFTKRFHIQEKPDCIVYSSFGVCVIW